MTPIYLDYNATTPIDSQVAEAMLPYIHGLYGNPSSGHAFGLEARAGVDRARHQVASMLGCHDDEVLFTSGGTESDNHAIKGIAGADRARGNHVITSNIEHPAVEEVCRYLEIQGLDVTYLPVDGHGLIDPQQVEDTITDRTIMVTIMHANNEVGTIQPIREIADIAHRHGAVMHSDCAQSVGKIPVDVDDLGVDLLTIAGHKLYAPKGIGVLYIRRGVEIEKFMHGADHEMGRRAGTENIILEAGLGIACQLIEQNLDGYIQHMGQMRDRLEAGLQREIPGVRVNGHPEKRLPNTSSVSFKGQEANTILDKLQSVAASAGAACHSDRIDVSAVLKAMNLPIEYAMGTIRLSVGRDTTEDEIDRAVQEIADVIRVQSHV
ncbi:MAG: cysteine desulfurase [Dehalococcoidia bacterium]|jgi:cysteine desulfurase NifS|nr:cysteine desulfurase [Dehalococcoidia bacterium]